MKKTNLIHIEPYPKPKKSGGGGTSNITFNINTSDIGGDLNVKSLNANRVMAEYVEANNLEATNGNFVYLVASDGTISTLRGNNLTYDTANIGDLTANNIETQKLTVTDTATIENIFNTYLNSKEIVTDYLTVNKSAHFFEVIIDKIKSVGGTIINTATSCVLDYVIPYNADGETTFDDPDIVKYRCYWKRYANENSQDKKDEVQNDWWVYDQAISQNCHLVSGVNHDAGNHYYWRLVTDVSGENPVYVNFDTGQVWEEEGIPEYQIKFSGHQAETQDDVTINAGFTYDNGETNTEDRPDAQIIITDWDIAPVSGIVEDWDETEKIFTVRDTINGLQIMPKPVGENDIVQAPYISKGTFSFATEYPTRLNLFIFYDDETVEYHPAPDVKQSIYQINLASITGAVATRFVITSAEVNIWHLCNWIDLSNTDKDAPTHLTGTFDDAPRAGDNVCQLGYRYNDGETDKDKISRASAIIIAAFKSPDDEVRPPSYAQYQYIRTYDLGLYRGTYMDADGAHFKGTLEAGSQIDPSVSGVTAKTWKLICNENPPISTHTITFSGLYFENGVSNDIVFGSNSDYTLQGTYFTLNGSGAITFNNYTNVTIGSSWKSIQVNLISDGNIKDTYKSNVLELGSITDGENGDFDETIYKAWGENTSTPETLEVCSSLRKKFSAYTTQEKQGWSESLPTTSSTYPHIWMMQRNVTYDSNNNATWGAWNGPMRITGDDGQPGTDGDFTEFIYTRNNTGGAPSAPPTSGTYPRDWPNNGTVDHQTDGNGVTWYDNPQGVTPTMMYEYVSSRQYNGATKTWSNYCPPAVWAKWGENGMDGDGVKYIFTKSASAINAPTFSGNGYPDTADYRQDTNNNQLRWYDEPLDPNSTSDYYGIQCNVLCSQSNTYEVINGVTWWKNWSTPKVWAMYVKDGQDGNPGQQGNKGDKGDDGDDGETWTIAPITEEFEVRIDRSNGNAVITFEGITSSLWTDLKYAVYHTVGETTTMLTDLTNYRLYIRANNTSNTTVNGTTKGTVTINGTELSYIGYKTSNFLLTMGAGGDNINYYYVARTNNSAYIVTELLVQLQKNTGTTSNPSWIDVKEAKRVVSLIFKPDHDFIVGDAALSSVYQGLSGTQGAWSTQGFSSILQNWQNINLAVNNIKKPNDGAEFYTSTNLTQYAWRLNTTSDIPSAPTDGNVPASSTSKVTWQLAHPTTNSEYPYGFVSHRDRTSRINSDGTIGYDSWSSWSTPRLYYQYIDGEGEKICTTVNTGQLDIKADEINLGVTTQIAGVEDSLRTTGINIADGTITLNADKTTMNGNFDLHGQFTAENSTYKTKVNIKNSTKPYISVSSPSLTTDEQKPAAATTEQVIISTVAEGATNNANAGDIKLKCPNQNITVQLNAENGVSYTKGSTSYLISWPDLLNPGLLNTITVSDTHWTYEGLELNEYVHNNIDVYIWKGTQTSNVCFYIGPTLKDNQGTTISQSSTGIYDGRVIRIHGFHGLCIVTQTAGNGDYPIILKNSYWGNSSINCLKLGTGTSSSNTNYNKTTFNNHKAEYNQYGITLVYHDNAWWEI